jgi:hypothetical protein
VFSLYLCSRKPNEKENYEEIFTFTDNRAGLTAHAGTGMAFTV